MVVIMVNNVSYGQIQIDKLSVCIFKGAQNSPQLPYATFPSFKIGICSPSSAPAIDRHYSSSPVLLTLRSSFYLSAIVIGVFLCTAVEAQEIPRPSLTRSSRGAPSFTRPYNLKLGPIALTANAGFGIQFVDNVNYTAVDPEGDIILTPSLGIMGVWQVTKLNSLDLQTTLSYTKYLQHPELDTQTTLISPDSAIRLNLFVGDFKIEIHEQFSLQEDPITDGGVSGVATLGRFTNIIGVSVLWDMNDVIWTLGYDHLNYISTGKAANTNTSTSNNLSALDHSVDQISTAVMLKISPTMGIGVEGTAAYSKYPHNPASDGSSFSLGPYLDMQLTRYTHIVLGAGYQLYSSENGGNSGPPAEFVSTPGAAPIGSGLQTGGRGAQNQGGDGSGFYFNLAIVHRLNRAYSDRLALGREFRVGLLSERTESTFINYSSQWALNRRFTLATTVFFEDVHQTGQLANSFSGSAGDYTRFGGMLATSYQLTKKLTINLSYQYTRKLSDVPSLEYAQNRFAIQFGYQF